MEQNKNRFNKGTKIGKELITRSIKELGCGRSVLTDKDGVIVCGNDVYDAAIELGKKVVTIETDGDVLVVVKRTDLTADSKRGKELAFVDNLTQEKNLDWDADLLQECMVNDLSFDPRKWGGHQSLIKDLPLEEFFDDNIAPKQTQQEQTLKENQLSLFDEFEE